MKRYIKCTAEAQYDAKLANRPWSPAEDKRTKEHSRKLYDLVNTDGWGEIYEENGIDEVESYNVVSNWGPNKGRQGQVTIYKNNIVYAGNYDENDRRVKQGKAIPGTTYYDVAHDGDMIDENIMGYATLNDARHAAMIYIKDYCRGEE